MKPTPAKPKIIMAHVEGSGTAEAKSAVMQRVDLAPSLFFQVLPYYFASGAWTVIKKLRAGSLVSPVSNST